MEDQVGIARSALAETGDEVVKVLADGRFTVHSAARTKRRDNDVYVMVGEPYPVLHSPMVPLAGLRGIWVVGSIDIIKGVLLREYSFGTMCAAAAPHEWPR